MLSLSMPSPMDAPSLPPNHGYRTGDLIAQKFRLVRPLGKGGMGVVWVAHNETLDVHVAIKVIDLRHVAKPKLVSARVLQEARTAARLAHPSICRVFDYGETVQGDPFVVTELLHGETLAELLKQESRMPPTRAVALLLPIAEGLAVAHTKGVVHRDVKPENIFLSHDDVARLQPKLLDFGIARFVEADHHLTQDGTLLGTPHYMSPEQARGETGIDARTDVWSLAILLYELMTGQTPFDGENYNALLWAIGHEDPKSLLDHGIPDTQLANILARGLKKPAAERWETMREMGERLAAWLHQQGVREDVRGVSLRATWLENTPLDPGPDPTLTDADASSFNLSPPSTDGGIVVVTATAEEQVLGDKLGLVFPSLGSERPRPASRRRLLAIGAGVLLLGGLVLGLGMGPSASPAGPPPEQGSQEAMEVGRAARTDLALPNLMATEVTSTPPAPSASSAPEPPKKRAFYPSRRKKTGKLDPERYDLGF
jgi:serine/threonine protein kinase